MWSRLSGSKSGGDKSSSSRGQDADTASVKTSSSSRRREKSDRSTVDDSGREGSSRKKSSSGKSSSSRGDDQDRGYDDDGSSSSKKRRSKRDSSPDSKDTRRRRSRSAERSTAGSSRWDDDRDQRRPGRRNTDPESRDVPMESTRGDFDTPARPSGFSQFPGQTSANMPGMPGGFQRSDSEHSFHNGGVHVPNMFPGQIPTETTAPFRPPMASHEGGPGLAADYYNDHGQSVQNQPGARPGTPVIAGTQPHLKPASQAPNPPTEPSASGGQGAAADYYNSGTNFGHTAERPAGASSGSARPQNTSSTAAAAATGMAAAGAAAGYLMGGTSQQPNGQNGSGGKPSRPNSDRPSSYYSATSAQQNRPSPAISPGTSSQHANTGVYTAAAAAGAAGLAAYAYHEHEQHEHQNQAGQSSAQYGVSDEYSKPPPGFHYTGSHYSHQGGYGSEAGYASGAAGAMGVAQQHRHHGPIAKFVDFFRDPEGVAKFEEYTEYIGVCRYCFDPRSSPRDAPRKHHYGRSRKSWENLNRSRDSLHSRKSWEKMNGSRSSLNRVDKDSRYGTGDEKLRRKSSGRSERRYSGEERRNSSGGGAGGLLAGAAAGVAAGMVGEKLMRRNTDFDDTYLVKQGKMAEDTLRLRHPNDRTSLEDGKRSSSAISVGVTGSRESMRKESKDEVIGVGRDGRPLRRKSSLKNGSASESQYRTKDDEKRKDHSIADAAAGAAIGAVAAAALSRKDRTSSPGRKGSKASKRRDSSASSSSSRRRRLRKQQSSEKSKRGIFGALFGGSSSKKSTKSSSSKKRKEKKENGIFTLGNASHSSTDSHLIFESDRAKYESSDSKSKGKRRKRSESPGIKTAADARNAMLALGGATALAAAVSKHGYSSSSEIKDRREGQFKDPHRIYDQSSRRLHSSHPEEAEWVDEESDHESVDSALAFGSSVHRKKSNGAVSTGGDGGWWPFGSKNERPETPPHLRDRQHSHTPPAALEALAAGGAGMLAGAALAEMNKRSSKHNAGSGSVAPLTEVPPMPLGTPPHHSDQRPGPTPLQPNEILQPQPVSPVKKQVYQAGQDHVPGEFPQDPADPRQNGKRSSIGPASRVSFNFTKEQEERHDRDDREEIARRRKKGYDDSVEYGSDDFSRKGGKGSSQYEEYEGETPEDRAHREELDRVNREIARLQSSISETEKKHQTDVVAAPMIAAGVGTAAVAAMIESRKKDRSEGSPEDRREKRRRERAKPNSMDGDDSAYDYSQISSETDKYNDLPDRGRDVTRTGELSKEELASAGLSRITKRAADIVRRSNSPANHESYAEFFGPVDGRNNASAEGEEAPEIITIQPKDAEDEDIKRSTSPYTFPGDEDFNPDTSNLRLSWMVPPLKLLRPTPEPSPRVEPVADEEMSKVEEISGETNSPTRKGVSFGENQTHHYSTSSPDRSRDEDVAVAGAGVAAAAVAAGAAYAINKRRKDSDTARREPETPVEELTREDIEREQREHRGSHVPGEFAEEPEFVAAMAAGLKDSGFDPNIVIDNSKYRNRDSPPGSEDGSSRSRQFSSNRDRDGGYSGRKHTPLEEVLGFRPPSPGTEGAPPVQGYAESLPDTPKNLSRSNTLDEEERAKSDIVIPHYDRVNGDDEWAESRQSGRKDKKKRKSKDGSGFAGVVAAATGAAAAATVASAVSSHDKEREVRPEDTETPEADYSKLSKKERKKLEKAAKRASLDQERIKAESEPKYYDEDNDDAELSIIDDAAREPEVDVPSSASKSKKKNRKSTKELMKAAISHNDDELDIINDVADQPPAMASVVEALQRRQKSGRSTEEAPRDTPSPSQSRDEFFDAEAEAEALAEEDTNTLSREHHHHHHHHDGEHSEGAPLPEDEYRSTREHHHHHHHDSAQGEGAQLPEDEDRASSHHHHHHHHHDSTYSEGARPEDEDRAATPTNKGVGTRHQDAQLTDRDQLYESPSDDAASVAATAIGVAEADRRKHKKRRSKHADDDAASVMSAPSRSDRTRDRESPKDEKRRSSIFGLFGKGSDDTEKHRSREEREREEAEKDKKKKKRRSKDGASAYGSDDDAISTTSRRSKGGSDEDTKAEKRRKRRSKTEDEDKPLKSSSDAFPDQSTETQRDLYHADQSFLGERPEPTKPPDHDQRFDSEGRSVLAGLGIATGAAIAAGAFAHHEHSEDRTSPTRTQDDLELPRMGASASPMGTPSRHRRPLSHADSDIGALIGPSPTAVPLVFRRPPNSRAGSNQSTPAKVPSTPSTPVSKKEKRPGSKEFKGKADVRPLYLVERHNKPVQVFEPEEQFPELPASRDTSRASSVHDSPKQEKGEDGKVSSENISARAIDLQEGHPEGSEGDSGSQQIPLGPAATADDRKQREAALLDAVLRERMSAELVWQNRQRKGSSLSQSPELPSDLVGPSSLEPQGLAKEGHRDLNSTTESEHAGWALGVGAALVGGGAALMLAKHEHDHAEDAASVPLPYGPDEDLELAPGERGHNRKGEPEAAANDDFRDAVSEQEVATSQRPRNAEDNFSLAETIVNPEVEYEDGKDDDSEQAFISGKKNKKQKKKEAKRRSEQLALEAAGALGAASGMEALRDLTDDKDSAPQESKFIVNRAEVEPTFKQDETLPEPRVDDETPTEAQEAEPEDTWTDSKKSKKSKKAKKEEKAAKKAKKSKGKKVDDNDDLNVPDEFPQAKSREVVDKGDALDVKPSIQSPVDEDGFPVVPAEVIAAHGGPRATSSGPEISYTANQGAGYAQLDPSMLKYIAPTGNGGNGVEKAENDIGVSHGISDEIANEEGTPSEVSEPQLSSQTVPKQTEPDDQDDAWSFQGITTKKGKKDKKKKGKRSSLSESFVPETESEPMQQSKSLEDPDLVREALKSTAAEDAAEPLMTEDLSEEPAQFESTEEDKVPAIEETQASPEDEKSGMKSVLTNAGLRPIMKKKDSKSKNTSVSWPEEHDLVSEHEISAPPSGIATPAELVIQIPEAVKNIPPGTTSEDIKSPSWDSPTETHWNFGKKKRKNSNSPSPSPSGENAANIDEALVAYKESEDQNTTTESRDTFAESPGDEWSFGKSKKGKERKSSIDEEATLSRVDSAERPDEATVESTQDITPAAATPTLELGSSTNENPFSDSFGEAAAVAGAGAIAGAALGAASGREANDKELSTEQEAPEPEIEDDWGFGKKKNKKKKKRESKQWETEEKAVQNSNVTAESEKELPPEDATEDVEKDFRIGEGQDTTEPQIAPAEVDDFWASTTSKKGKKSKSKRKGSQVELEDNKVATETLESGELGQINETADPPLEQDEWANFTTKKSKKEKKKNRKSKSIEEKIVAEPLIQSQEETGGDEDLLHEATQYELPEDGQDDFFEFPEEDAQAMDVDKEPDEFAKDLEQSADTQTRDLSMSEGPGEFEMPTEDVPRPVEEEEDLWSATSKSKKQKKDKKKKRQSVSWEDEVDATPETGASAQQAEEQAQDESRREPVVDFAAGAAAVGAAVAADEVFNEQEKPEADEFTSVKDKGSKKKDKKKKKKQQSVDYTEEPADTSKSDLFESEMPQQENEGPRAAVEAVDSTVDSTAGQNVTMPSTAEDYRDIAPEPPAEEEPREKSEQLDNAQNDDFAPITRKGSKKKKKKDRWTLDLSDDPKQEESAGAPDEETAESSGQINSKAEKKKDKKKKKRQSTVDDFGEGAEPPRDPVEEDPAPTDLGNQNRELDEAKIGYNATDDLDEVKAEGDQAGSLSRKASKKSKKKKKQSLDWYDEPAEPKEVSEQSYREAEPEAENVNKEEASEWADTMGADNVHMPGSFEEDETREAVMFEEPTEYKDEVKLEPFAQSGTRDDAEQGDADIDEWYSGKNNKVENQEQRVRSAWDEGNGKDLEESARSHEAAGVDIDMLVSSGSLHEQDGVRTAPRHFNDTEAAEQVQPESNQEIEGGDDFEAPKSKLTKKEQKRLEKERKKQEKAKAKVRALTSDIFGLDTGASASAEPSTGDVTPAIENQDLFSDAQTGEQANEPALQEPDDAGNFYGEESDVTSRELDPNDTWEDTRPALSKKEKRRKKELEAMAASEEAFNEADTPDVSFMSAETQENDNEPTEMATEEQEEVQPSKSSKKEKKEKKKKKKARESAAFDETFDEPNLDLTSSKKIDQANDTFIPEKEFGGDKQEEEPSEDVPMNDLVDSEPDQTVESKQTDDWYTGENLSRKSSKKAKKSAAAHGNNDAERVNHSEDNHGTSWGEAAATAALTAGSAAAFGELSKDSNVGEADGFQPSRKSSKSKKKSKRKSETQDSMDLDDQSNEVRDESTGRERKLEDDQYLTRDEPADRFVQQEDFSQRQPASEDPFSDTWNTTGGKSKKKSKKNRKTTNDWFESDQSVPSNWTEGQDEDGLEKSQSNVPILDSSREIVEEPQAFEPAIESRGLSERRENNQHSDLAEKSIDTGLLTPAASEWADTSIYKDREQPTFEPVEEGREATVDDFEPALGKKKKKSKNKKDSKQEEGFDWDSPRADPEFTEYIGNPTHDVQRSAGNEREAEDIPDWSYSRKESKADEMEEVEKPKRQGSKKAKGGAVAAALAMFEVGEAADTGLHRTKTVKRKEGRHHTEELTRVLANDPDLPEYRARSEEHASTTPKKSIERDPSPVDSTSKERSQAMLFSSSPSIRDTPTKHHRHRSIEEIAGERPRSSDRPKSLFGGPFNIEENDTIRSSPATPGYEARQGTPLMTITEQSPEESAEKRRRHKSEIYQPKRRSIAHMSEYRSQSPSSDYDRARRLGHTSGGDLLTQFEEDGARGGYEEKRRSSGRHDRPHSIVTSGDVSAAHRSVSNASMRSSDSISAVIRDVDRPTSASPSLRRERRSVSSDLRKASGSRAGEIAEREQRPVTPKADESSKGASAGEVLAGVGLAGVAAAAAAGFASSSNYDPSTDKGKGRAIEKMANVYEAWGEVPGSPRSPSRPPSVRKRQSLQILDLESRLDSLVSENRQLNEARSRAERQLENVNTDHSSSINAQQEAIKIRDDYLQQKDSELEELRNVLNGLQGEVARLTQANQELTVERSSSINYEEQFRQLQAEHQSTRDLHEQSTRELEEMQTKHSTMSKGMEGMIAAEVSAAVAAAAVSKNSEITQLKNELDSAREQIRQLQEQLLEAKNSSPDDDVLTARDADYFDRKCQQLCQHVQQWVLRFSKFSDRQVARSIEQITNERTVDRFEYAMLDGTDVDELLRDRIRRRDVFMAVVMAMVFEFIFSRYLFGMDREQRSKLKSLEKTLSEVGSPSAVNRWRATTLSLLSRREKFQQQREQDTEAVVAEIMDTLGSVLPPPQQVAEQLSLSLAKVMKLAVDLAVDMRTQRVEYQMLPPLQPEYDTHGDLKSTVRFRADLMNERSGAFESNDEVQESGATVRMVLFPLVVERGEDGENVVCPAQVLVAREDDGRGNRRSGLGGNDEAMKSRMSIAPSTYGGPSEGGMF